MRLLLRNPNVQVLLCWIALNLPLLLGFRVLPGDALNEFYPMVHFNVHAIRQGMAPWWNPMIFSGYPQIADPQAMLFSPLLMAWMLLRDDPGMTWFVWGALLHVLGGGLAFAAFVRRIQCSPAASVMGAIVFMAGGVAASRIQYVPILIVYCLLPAALLAIRWFVDRPGARRGMALGTVAGCMLVQPVQLTYLAGIMLCAYVCMLVIGQRRRWCHFADARRLAWGALVACVACVVIALPQIALTYAFLQVSNRPQIDLATASALSVPLRSLLTLVAPNAVQGLRGSYQGPTDPIETFFYIGALPGLLILAGFKRSLANARHRRYLLLAAGMAAGSVVYMAGSHTPVYPWLHAHLPGVDLFRRPSDAGYLLNLALALATAMTASHAFAVVRLSWFTLFAGATVWLAVSCYGMQGDGESWQVATIVAPVAAFAAALWAIKARGPAVPMAALCMVTVVDYRCFNLNGEFNQFRDTPRQWHADGAATFVARSLQVHRTDQLPLRAEVNGVGALWKNGVGLLGIPATSGYGPLRWAVYDRWYGAYGDGNGPRPSTPVNPDPSSPLNRLLGVTYLVQDADAIESQGTRVFASRRASVWVLDQALPRLLTPAEARVFPLGVQPTAADFADADFRQAVFLTPRNAAGEAGASEAATRCVAGANVVSVNRRHTLLTIQANNSVAGWLTLSELDFPGWVASVDGVEVPFLRANGMFRALCIPEGPHRIQFEFRPWRMVAAVLSEPDAWR